MASDTESFKMNKKRVSHEFAIKHINATNTKGYAAHEFNEKTQTVEVNSFAFSIPNICYRLDF